MEAFDAALQHGCDGFEFDVRLTRDGHAVVCHNARSRGRWLAKSNFAQCAHLPRLEEVIGAFGKRAFLDIELKVRGMEEPVLSALQQHPPERGYVVSSFLKEVLVKLRELSEYTPLGIICDRSLPNWRELPVNYVIPRTSLVTRALVEELHSAQKCLVAWTVNDKASMLRLASWKVDGIISDKTDLLVETLRPNRKPNSTSSVGS